MKRQKPVVWLQRIIVVVGMSLVLTGCQNIKEQMSIIQSQSTTERTTTEEIVVTETGKRVNMEKKVSEENTTEQKTTEKVISESVDTEEKTTEKQTTEAQDEEKYEAYQNIIDKYVELNSEGVTYEECNSLDFPYEVAENLYSKYNVLIVCGNLSDVGYVIEDIDGDGIKELIFANPTTSLIYEVYTMDDDTPKLVLASWERSTINYCGDHYCVEGSSGAANYVISSGNFRGGEWKTEYHLYTDMMENGEIGYFYTTNDTVDKSVDTQITQDEYNNIKEDAESGMCTYPNLNNLIEFGRCILEE